MTPLKPVLSAFYRCRPVRAATKDLTRANKRYSPLFKAIGATKIVHHGSYHDAESRNETKKRWAENGRTRCSDLFRYSTIRSFNDAGQNIATLHIRKSKSNDEVFLQAAATEAARASKAAWQGKQLVIDGAKRLGGDFNETTVFVVKI